MTPAPYFSGRALVVAAILAIGLAPVFLLRPGIDLVVAGWFHDGARFFWRTPMTEVLRDLGRLLPALLAVAAALVLLVRVFRPQTRTPFDARASVFLLTTLALGPGLIVNGILKQEWGRPRPGQVTEFGGALPFQPPFIPTDFCPSNCSFVSGEVSAMAWVMALAVVLSAGRRFVFWGGLVLALGVGLLRAGFGGHFFSDVLYGIAVSYFTIAACAAVFSRIPTARFEGVAGRLGRALGRS